MWALVGNPEDRFSQNEAQILKLQSASRKDTEKVSSYYEEVSSYNEIVSSYSDIKDTFSL